MANGGSGIVAKKPDSIWDRPVEIKSKDVLKALSNGIGKVAVTKKWWGVGPDVIDAITAVGFKTEPGQLAFQLISRSIARAAIALLGESVGEQLATDRSKSDHVIDQIDGVIASGDAVCIDKRFMDRPAELPVLKDLQGVIKQWLVGCGLDDKVDVNRLPIEFVKALDQEWRENEATYRPIIEALEGPFRKAFERDLGWVRYAGLLRRNTEEKVFDEPFGLDQLYIPLNAYYVEGDSEEKKSRVVAALEDEITRWLQETDKKDAIRVISGGPGSGKSTFAKMFAAKLAQEGSVKVIYVPLHMINATKDLVEEIGELVKAEKTLAQNPLDLDSPEPNLLVILDGLDELSIQGKAAAETAKAFVVEVERTVNKYNLQKFCLRVLISGREIVVQESEKEFRRKGQILTLLPYFTPYEEKGDYDDPEGILQQDLRDRWWRRYGSLKGTGYEDMPGDLKRDDLDEITAQPLLNYLLALSYMGGGIDFSKEVTRNNIYNDLIVKVHKRECENRSFCMELKDFRRVLEEIGLAAWQSGDGRKTTVQEIEVLCKESKLNSQLEAFMETAKAGVTRLLAAFFFRRSEDVGGDKTFVFTHKSFGEYLAACRIVRAMERINRNMQVRDLDPEDVWTERKALVHWAEICGPSDISRNIHEFLLNEVQLRSKEEVQQWQGCFTKLFNYVLRHGMPMEAVSTEYRKVDTFPKMLFQSRNAEEALLAALNACARKTEDFSAIEHPTPEAFGTWFKRIQGQPIWFENILAAMCLSFLNLKGVNLGLTDFSYANLSRADLSDSDLSDSDFTDADLSRANLQFADFNYADLTRANLSGTNLNRAKFNGTYLSGANLTDANLMVADLSGASLRRANLSRANLIGADLTGAILTDANLGEISVEDT
ncbi:MAG: pentapeptide repeat-containing protein [Nitrospirae bacterium]|nr:pentapeptide repeat-containing protein [Nitrospirota bacterium]